MKKLIDLGVKGFTVHPRPDERHIRYQDVYDISAFLKDYPEIEFNIEGNPNEQFLKIIREVKPHQCTLVPDSDDQLTSDHGFDIITHHEFLSTLSKELQAFGTRCAVFIDPDIEQIKAVIESDVQTIEMYTEEWARATVMVRAMTILISMRSSNALATVINLANQNGIRVNAGHDLNLENLADLLALSDIAEVSIGHAFTIESLEQGMDNVVRQYLDICA
ncbi:LOW QUALITY PROTEIN: pyridoxine 5'-phosphate synthase [Psychrobacter sp. JCM 18902]|nr:LOW QUALITY PROTEIN: pyridoxine 5'-phosphate synthase [Psychrobacter sp. JCM 18902]